MLAATAAPPGKTAIAHPLILLLALAVDAAIGYPPALFRRIGHPVSWIGALIGLLDARLNNGTRGRGILAEAIIILAATLPALALQLGLFAVLPRPWAMIVCGLLASTLLAQRSLYQHVRDVAVALHQEGLSAARLAVGRIVGRNPDTLNAAGVARAAIESLAENFSDGVVAPSLWGAVFGLPGIAFYKAVNTADSMIGHRSPRHAQFGWAAARLDDVVNLPASRLAALLLLAAARFGGDAPGAWRALLRDARHHRSPNAGWPEAAMAGALGLRLAGPRIYGTARVDDAWMGDGRAEANAADISRALDLFRLACLVLFAAIALVALIWPG